MKKRILISGIILLSAAMLAACSAGQSGDSSVVVKDEDSNEVTGEVRGSIDDDGEDVSEVRGGLFPVVSGSITPISENSAGKETLADSIETAKGEELWALADSEEEAEEIAKLYGIELVQYAQGVATFHTDEDPAAVVQRGRDNEWPALAVNNTGKLVD